MRIARLEALPFTFWHDREPLSYCLVRVESDDGLVGWGEVCDSFGCTYGSVVETLVADAFAPLAIDEAADPDPLIHKLHSWTRRRLGDQWIGRQAMSGVELALWDLVGKARDTSVADLLGAPGRTVGVYASSVFLEEGPADWHLALLEPCLSRGVRAVKVRLGVDWRDDLETLAALRAALGPDVEVLIDGNENFTVATATIIAARLDEIGIGWFEEPIPQSNRGAIEELAARSPVPIAYGEHQFGLSDFEETIRRQQATVLQPDPATCGGLTEARRIAEAGADAGARVVPHTAAGPVALAAVLHLAASVPSISMVEYPFPLAECWAAIAPTSRFAPSDLVDGALGVPDGPGLGVEIDESRVRRMPYHRPEPRSGPSTRFMGDV